MKEVKAFVHRGRVAEIVHALNTAGYRHLTVIDVRGLLRELSAREEEYPSSSVSVLRTRSASRSCARMTTSTALRS